VADDCSTVLLSHCCCYSHTCMTPEHPSQEDVLEVADECSSDAARRDASGRRLARTLQALLGLSSQMQDSMGAERPHRHKQSVGAAIGRLAAVAAGRRS